MCPYMTGVSLHDRCVPTWQVCPYMTGVSLHDRCVPTSQVCPYITGVCLHMRTPFCKSDSHSEGVREWLSFRGCPFSHQIQAYCTEGVLSSECPLKTGFTAQRVSSHQSVPWRQVLLHRGCPLIRVSPEDRFAVRTHIVQSDHYV